MRTVTKAPKAFTLLEMLVVIAIIGILAALLLPVLGRAKVTGKRAICLNNFKQIANGCICRPLISTTFCSQSTPPRPAGGITNGRLTIHL